MPPSYPSSQNPFSRVTINRRASSRIIKRAQEDRRTGAQIRRTAEYTHGFIQLIFIASRDGAREPHVTVLRGDPVEGAGGERGEAVSLVVDCGAVAAVDEVDEEGAGGSGIGIGEKAAVGVYVDGLGLFGVLGICAISYGSGTPASR